MSPWSRFHFLEVWQIEFFGTDFKQRANERGWLRQSPPYRCFTESAASLYETLRASRALSLVSSRAGLFHAVSCCTRRHPGASPSPETKRDISSRRRAGASNSLRLYRVRRVGEGAATNSLSSAVAQRNLRPTTVTVKCAFGSVVAFIFYLKSISVWSACCRVQIFYYCPDAGSLPLLLMIMKLVCVTRVFLVQNKFKGAAQSF
jgi:hypothetical protein